MGECMLKKKIFLTIQIATLDDKQIATNTSTGQVNHDMTPLQNLPNIEFSFSATAEKIPDLKKMSWHIRKQSQRNDSPKVWARVVSGVFVLARSGKQLLEATLQNRWPESRLQERLRRHPVSCERPTLQASSGLRTCARWTHSPAFFGVSDRFLAEHVECSPAAGLG